MLRFLFRKYTNFCRASGIIVQIGHDVGGNLQFIFWRAPAISSLEMGGQVLAVYKTGYLLDCLT